MRWTLLLMLLWMFSLAPPAQAANPVARVDTSLGSFDIELCASQPPGTLCAGTAPNAVNNFLNYVNDGDYTSSIIHRSFPGGVIEGGRFFHDGFALVNIPTDPPIQNHFNQSNLRGTVAMAREKNPPQPGDVDTATSQWFVNVADNSDPLDTAPGGGFTVFGVVNAAGMAVVDAINSALVCDIRAQVGVAWGETPLINYPPASCNPPTFPAIPPPVNPPVMLSDLVVVNSITVVPEPGQVLLQLSAGLAVVGLARRRRAARVSAS